MREGGPHRKSLPLAAVAGAAVLIAVAAIAAVVLAGGDGGDGGSDPASFKPEPAAAGDRFLSDPENARHHPVAHLARSRLLYDRPGGKPKVRVAGETEWNTPRVLAVVERRGRWVGVLAPELKNAQVGWIRMRDVTSFDTVAWSLHADLSRREVVIRREGKAVRRFRVGVGREGHSTPTGRFAVTDRLRVQDPASPYGCCVLALSGHQVRLPPGWPGGDRLAFHATSNPGDLGNPVSLGCMRADPRDARWLIRQVPLGSPVFIRE